MDVHWKQTQACVVPSNRKATVAQISGKFMLVHVSEHPDLLPMRQLSNRLVTELDQKQKGECLLV